VCCVLCVVLCCVLCLLCKTSGVFRQDLMNSSVSSDSVIKTKSQLCRNELAHHRVCQIILVFVILVSLKQAKHLFNWQLSIECCTRSEWQTYMGRPFCKYSYVMGMTYRLWLNLVDVRYSLI